MKILLSLFGVLVCLVSVSFSASTGRQISEGQISGRQSSVTTKSLVKKHGYPFEEHTVETSDGYILTMHRIPYSSRVESYGKDDLPVIFLMHGLLSSSSDWVLLGADRALAYLLSDLGYDVWMGNARGNVYSREHIKHSTWFNFFWDFDWHEIGMYDLPAMIDYICELTGQEQLTYFGHSQGTTTFLVVNSLDSSFKDRIKAAHLLAPVAYMDHLQSPLVKYGSWVFGQANYFPELFGSMEFLPNSKLMEILGYTACSKTSMFQALCTNSFFLLGGYDSENLDEDLIPDILATSPAGSSVNQVLHYMQERNSGYFRQFDFGYIRNKIHYGTFNPPEYPLENVDVPLYLYYSENDYLAAVSDVEKLIEELPKSSVRGTYVVPHPSWNHFDFLWGLNAFEQVYAEILTNLASDQ